MQCGGRHVQIGMCTRSGASFVHQRRADPVQRSGSERNQRHDAAVHGAWMHEPDHRIDGDKARDREQQAAIGQRREDRRPVMTERSRHRRAAKRVPQGDDRDGQPGDVRQIVPCIGKQPEGMREHAPDDLRHDDRDVEHDRDHQPLLAAGVPALRGAHVINGTPVYPLGTPISCPSRGRHHRRG